MLKLIYYSHDVRKKGETPFHCHKFWQLEIILSDRISLKTDHEERILPPNSIVMIPPETNHQLRYLENDSEYISLKFEYFDGAPENRISIIPETDDNVLLRDSLTKYLSGRNILTPGSTRVTEHLISAVLENNISSEEKDELFSIAEDYVASHCFRQITVTDLAQATGCSVSLLNLRFREKREISPKKFIDIERGKLIRSYLLYSTLSIAQIAEKMNFPDIYSFSRFCKRLNGSYPGELRKLNTD